MPAEAGTNKWKRRRWLTAYAPLIIWTILTLGLGTALGSMSETSRFIRPLLEFLFPSANPESITFYHGVIRKFAHLFEYGVLGLLAIRAFSTERVRPILAIAFVALTACVDELNQSFNPGRTSSPWDVLLDVLGASLGISSYWLAHRFRRR